MKLRGDQSHCPTFNSLSGQILTPQEGRGEISKSRLTLLLRVLKGLSQVPLVGRREFDCDRFPGFDARPVALRSPVISRL